MRLVFLGTGDFGVPALHALLRAGHVLTGAISQPDRPAGRGREVRPTPIREAAEALQINHLQADDVNAVSLDVFRRADLGVVAAFGQKIGPQILAALPHGCVNIHGSLLPRYRGAAPFQRAIIGGDEVTGVSIFQLNERWDAGQIWAARATRIGELETADELHDRLAALGAELIVDVLEDYVAGRVVPRPQAPMQASRAPKLSKAEGHVDWSQPARQVIRRIHGLWSWPAAASWFDSRRGKQERVLLIRAEVVTVVGTPSAEFPAGAIWPDQSVQTGAGRVRLLELQPAGGRRMPFEAFANGRQVAPPDRFLPVVS